ncbi:hypothetical protein B0H19DRAFT_1123453, partial [Mycena capillaripes]
VICYRPPPRALSALSHTFRSALAAWTQAVTSATAYAPGSYLMYSASAAYPHANSSTYDGELVVAGVSDKMGRERKRRNRSWRWYPPLHNGPPPPKPHVPRRRPSLGRERLGPSRSVETLRGVDGASGQKKDGRGGGGGGDVWPNSGRGCFTGDAFVSAGGVGNEDTVRTDFSFSFYSGWRPCSRRSWSRSENTSRGIYFCVALRAHSSPGGDVDVDVCDLQVARLGVTHALEMAAELVACKGSISVSMSMCSRGRSSCASVECRVGGMDVYVGDLNGVAFAQKYTGDNKHPRLLCNLSSLTTLRPTLHALYVYSLGARRVVTRVAFPSSPSTASSLSSTPSTAATATATSRDDYAYVARGRTRSRRDRRQRRRGG